MRFPIYDTNHADSEWEFIRKIWLPESRQNV